MTRLAERLGMIGLALAAVPATAAAPAGYRAPAGQPVSMVRFVLTRAFPGQVDPL